jgi:MYXO-CTERM domain-containing protein
VRVAWRIESDGGLTYGGWNLDDVCVYAPATADNRLGISDLVVARAAGSDEVTVTFTQPRHAPVREVRVVRRRGDWPSGPDDGDVVWSTDRPEPGEPVTVSDSASGADWYYAAYATDGDAWLSWTREGWNAGAIDPVPADQKGCGCASSGPGGGWLGLAGLVVVGLRRRAARRSRPRET